MYSSAYVWAKVLSHMEERLGSVTVSAWFDDAEVVELNEEQLIIYSANEFRREIIRRRCTEYIHDALKDIFKSDAKLIHRISDPQLILQGIKDPLSLRAVAQRSIQDLDLPHDSTSFVKIRHFI